MRWRRVWWWASWQAWLFAHPPADVAALWRWAWGRLGCWLVATVAWMAAVTLLGIGWWWLRWVLGG
jgi:hypothetical protein